jgi:photolyase PhrII
MHHACRVDENPALDAAIEIAARLDEPLLVYSSLHASHPFASDRHFTFAMEGLRYVSEALHGREISFAFHLGRDETSESPLLKLSDAASVVVTEDYPAPPYPAAVAKLASRTDTPIWAVDSHCIVPMQSVDRPYSRAFHFRKRISDGLDARLVEVWPTASSRVKKFEGELPFEAVDLSQADIATLCANLPIDHSIGPVPHTRGGSDHGYDRWNAFLGTGLTDYDKLRNDPTVLPPRGVSRISAYLHFGQISPFRVAREAKQNGSDGAEKFLDELVTWRELAFNLCFHRTDVDRLSILPDWARSTLEKHATDPRENLYSWERLSRGRTGNVLWDAGQVSLLRHGELHNNVRMTWGKEILNWTSGPESALRTLIDLNHRFALDGSDPASYGGLLWCMGLFDRPFGPERDIIGIVRPRSSERHAKRLDMAAYLSHVNRPTGKGHLDVAVVGAGISGLVAARTLLDHGHRVKVIDKARGPGGRLASRRDGELTFDHGAQYFTVSDPRFRRLVDSWVFDGLVSRWEGKIGVFEKGSLSAKDSDRDRFVGRPRMSAITRYLSSELDSVYGSLVTDVQWSDGAWHVRTGDEDLSPFDALVVTTPPEQAAPLIAASPELEEIVANVKMLPCWALMMSFDDELPTPFDGIFVNEGPLGWVARNSSKPGRSPVEAWVAHASPRWSQENLELSKEEVQEPLLAAFFESIQTPRVEAAKAVAHRWRYALAEEPIHDQCLWDPDRNLAVAGDWVMGSRIEGAVLSGMAAAGRILGVA